MNQKPYVLGLTGSIGMGKTTTARMFAAAGISVWDADATVHELYQAGGAATRQIEKLVPGSVTESGVDRAVLKAAIADDKTILQKLEVIVAPLVANSRDAFITASQSDIVIIDHPLLFESGTAQICDGVLVVTTSADEQRRRVLDRGTMTAEMFETILAKQMPDSEKRARADFIVETTTLADAESAVHSVIAEIRGHLNA